MRHTHAVRQTQRYETLRQMGADIAIGADPACIRLGLAGGRRIALWPSLETDRRNPGTERIDEELVAHRGLFSRVANRRHPGVQPRNDPVVQRRPSCLAMDVAVSPHAQSLS